MNRNPELALADQAACDRPATAGARVLSVACGLGAPDPRCAEGPPALLSRRPDGLAGRAEWADCFPCEPGPSRLKGIAHSARLLAHGVHRALQDGGRVLVLEGDHAFAAGTWSGAAAACRRRGRLGLVWVDAHMDCHTPATSPTGNPHGMPLAALLGCGPRALTRLYGPGPTLDPAHVVIVGVRSYEAEEVELARRLGLRVVFMNEVARRGLKAVMEEALAIAGAGTAGFGVSVDLDAVDPNQAPGVTCPVPDGLDGGELVVALARARRQPGFVGADLAEYTPARDPDGRTSTLALDLMAAALGGQELEHAPRA
jgi:arginase